MLISLHCKRFRVLFYFTSLVTFVLVRRSLSGGFFIMTLLNVPVLCVLAVVELRRILEQLFNKTLVLKLWCSYREEEERQQQHSCLEQ